MAWVDKRLVAVEWKDAACEAGWQSPGQGFRPALCCTVGLLMHDDDEILVIAGTITESGDFNQVMTIPRLTVVSITDVRIDT